MAAIYDQQGNYVGDDGAPSLDQMQLELIKKNQPLSSQIPGYDRPVPPAQTSPAANPLEAAAGNFTQLATKFNPLMMAKSMREAAGIVTVPAVAAVKGVGESILTSPSGTYTSGQAPKYAEASAKKFMEANAPQTPLTQEFASAIAPVMQELPAYLGHLSTGRPALTPNDLRVMGAEATRVGRQVKDIPTDFANAQSGLQKLDPITGQPTYGAKLQGVAESVGDIAAARRAEGKSLIPGIPDVVTPESSLYAVRPAGSRLVRSSAPETANVSRAWDKDVLDSVGTGPLEPSQAWNIISNDALTAGPLRNGFRLFLENKYKELYPDAPSLSDAKEAFQTLYNDRNSRAAKTLEFYDEYLKTPEAIAAGAEQLPTASDVKARHDAATQWLNSNLLNYIQKNVGAEGDPLVKLASEGLTYLPADKYHDALQSAGGKRLVEQNRLAGGMPLEGGLAEPIAKKESEFAEAQSKVRELEAKRQNLANIAMQQGLPDPAMLPEYAALTNPVRAAIRERDKLEDQLSNLKTGQSYEAAVDYGVIPSRAKDFLTSQIEYAERQFYPSVVKTPPEENVYRTYGGHLESLGFNKLAEDFYRDVMSGDIPLDKVNKMTVENYVRNTAKARIDEEKAAKEAAKAYKRNAEAALQQRARELIPNDKTFGNAGVIELTKDTPEYDIIRTMSEDTAVLDHCVGQGGSAADDDRNPWYGNSRRSYEPILDLVTGQPNPRSTRDRTTYVTHVLQGDKIASVRDLSTGLPQATLHLEQTRIGANGQQKYSIGYASGHQNGDIDAKYAPAIRDYLNSIADQIDGAGHNLESHAGVYDMYDADFGSAMRRALNMSKQHFEKYDLQNLPRFVTLSDVRAAIKAADLSAASPAKSELIALNHAMEDAMQEHADLMRMARRRPMEDADREYVAELESTINMLRQRINDIEQQAQLPATTPAPATNMAYRTPSQAEANAIIGAIDNVGNTQAFDLRNEVNETARDMFMNTIATLARENGITEVNIDNIPDFGRSLQGLRNDIDGQMYGLRQMGFEGRAVADALEAVNDVIARHIQNLETGPDEAAIAADALMAEAEPDLFANPVPFDFAGAVDRITAGVAANLGNALGNVIGERFNTIAHRFAEQVNPRLDPVGYAEALRRANPAVEHAAVISALNELADEVEASANGDNVRNARVAEITEILNDPDIDPDTLRRAANAIGNPLTQNANNHWMPLGADERRNFATQLHQRANYIEFNPRDFAQRLINEAGNDRIDIETTVDALRNGEMDHDVLRGLPPIELARAEQRTAIELSRLLQEQGNAAAPAPAPALAQRDPIRDTVRNATDTQRLRDALNDAERSRVSVAIDQARLGNNYFRGEEGANTARRLAELIREYSTGFTEGMTQVERELVARALDSIADARELFGDENPPPEGNAEGGPVRGYQKGGSVKADVPTPWLFSVPTYSETVAYEMYPGQKGQDDQRDAARHMLAAGTLSRKYGPGVAEFLGKAHEFTTSPLQAVKTLFGGQMPADYGMDTHNNAVGAALGQRAKSQAELEDLVQAEAERASRTQTPGQAFIKRANGGIVQQNPTTDQMRYALMMRRK